MSLPKPKIKLCNQCRQHKLHDYRIDRRKPSGHVIKEKCRDCMRLYYRARKHTHLSRKLAIKKQCVEYLGGACLLCGLKDDCLAVYDFHHLDPSQKDFNINARKYRSFARLKPELDKCQLLCATCHRRITAKCTCRDTH